MLEQPTPLFPDDRWRHLTDSDRGWLAGLIDGEGCFRVRRCSKANGGEPNGCLFKVNLRLDDADCLRHAKAITGLGHLFVDRSPSRMSAKWSPQMVWGLNGRSDCAALRNLLDPSGPGRLRSKKARDFETWSLALDAWAARDWRWMHELDLTLRAGRAYSLQGGQREALPTPENGITHGLES